MIAPMASEPCDTAVSNPADWAVREQHTRQALGLSPCGWLDLLGQGVTSIGRIQDLKIVGEWL